MKTETQVQLINEKLLPLIPSDTILEKVESEKILSLYAPSLVLFSETLKQADGINKKDPANEDAIIARKVRLALVKVRTGAIAIKEAGKAEYIIKNRLHDAAFNVVKNSCELAELELEAIEKDRENKIKAEQDKLSAARKEELVKYNVDTTYLPLGTMTDEQYNSLLQNSQIAFKAKQDAEIAAEKARIEAEKAEAERIEKERKEAEEKRKAEAERLRLAEIENAKLKKEAEAKELQRQKEIEEENKRVAKLQEEARQKLQKEQEEKAALFAKIKAKEDAELAEKKRILEEQKANELKAKEAAKAPSKEQLKEWIKAFNMPIMPVIKETDIQEKALEITLKFSAFKKWAIAEIDKI